LEGLFIASGFYQGLRKCDFGLNCVKAVAYIKKE